MEGCSAGSFRICRSSGSRRRWVRAIFSWCLQFFLCIKHEGVGYFFFGRVGEFYAHVGVPLSHGPDEDQESVVLFRNSGGVLVLHYLDRESVGFSDVLDFGSLRSHESAQEVRVNPKALGDFIQSVEWLVPGFD
jgi:hypothetical protein